MTNTTPARSYRIKAEKRLKILDVLLKEEAFSDVIREAREIVELALKGMLRQVGVEPPKWHDVGAALVEFAHRFPDAVAADVQELARVFRWLRKEREFSFYGDIDFIPTEEYTRDYALQAIKDAAYVCRAAAGVIPLS